MAGRETRITLILDRTASRGNLSVKSEPTGARWYLDGAYVGTTPDEVDCEVGKHRVEMKKEGYKDWSETIQVGARGRVPVNAKLERIGPEPGEIWRESETGMEFVWVPGRCYKMGSPSAESGRSDDEGPVHEVCVDGFWMGRYEVMNGQYRMYHSNHDSGDYKGHDLNGRDQPVVSVSWEDARAYADWLTGRNRGGYTFRLPMEAEWEYACRAGTRTAQFWGESPDDACRHANVLDRTSRRVFIFDWTHHNCDDGYAVTAPVGSFQPNRFGLCDMLGNVSEWCEDIYNGDAYGKHQRNNPIYTGGGSDRVIRGGNWDSWPSSVRCASRGRKSPDHRFYLLGFRLLRTP